MEKWGVIAGLSLASPYPTRRIIITTPDTIAEILNSINEYKTLALINDYEKIDGVACDPGLWRVDYLHRIAAAALDSAASTTATVLLAWTDKIMYADTGRYAAVANPVDKTMLVIRRAPPRAVKLDNAEWYINAFAGILRCRVGLLLPALVAASGAAWAPEANIIIPTRWGVVGFYPTARDVFKHFFSNSFNAMKYPPPPTP